VNVTIKLDDTLCREARHRAVDADLSLSGWIAELICERLGLPPATGRPGKTLLEMLGQAAQKPEMCFLSAFTLLEIRLGIEMARKKDKKKAEGLEAWYQDRAKPSFAGRVLPVD
jgi:hypothetical protein